MQNILRKAAVKSHRATTSDRPSLSKREGEVFQLLGCGYGPSQTAEELRVSVKTVEGYLDRIKKKLHIGDARTLRQYAIQQGRSMRKPPGVGICL
ncbi:MAG TPA: helix-turn-helix transcriptional regulator [Verrucomicrobiae bacterium]|nr:helix-turn-helix transcriptional regulator [Verrucomicrobiae bacterium]